MLYMYLWKSWMQLSRASKEYFIDLEIFLDFVFANQERLPPCEKMYKCTLAAVTMLAAPRAKANFCSVTRSESITLD